MLEILVMLIVFSKSGEILRGKGWSKTLAWEFLGILVYVLSFAVGVIAYVVLGSLISGEIIMAAGLKTYIAGYFSVFVGVSSYFRLLRSFSPREGHDPVIDSEAA